MPYYGPSGSSVSAATQAEQETGTATNVYVSPGRQQYHTSASKGWIVFNGTGTVAIGASYNVTSITDNGTGNYTVTWATDFSGAEYGYSIIAEATSGSHPFGISAGNATRLAGSIDVKLFQFSGSALDYPGVSVLAFGDQ